MLVSKDGLNTVLYCHSGWSDKWVINRKVVHTAWTHCIEGYKNLKEPEHGGLRVRRVAQSGTQIKNDGLHMSHSGAQATFWIGCERSTAG